MEPQKTGSRWKKIAPHPDSVAFSPPSGATPVTNQLLDGSSKHHDSQNKRKRSTIRLACDACRKRKVACDGERPTCVPCMKRNIKCLYSIKDASGLASDDLTQRRLGRDASELLDFFRTMPNDESYKVLQKIKSGGNLAAILPSLRDRYSKERKQSTTLSNPRTSRNSQFPSFPPTATGLEFELNIRHQIAYPTIFPIYTASVEEDTFLNLTVSRGLSPISESFQANQKSDGLNTTQEREVGLRSTLAHNVSQYISPSVSTSEPSDDASTQAAPLPSLTLCDERLLRLDISQWTDVNVTNDLAARAISVYLENDHPVLGLFDSDLFLQDLVNVHQNFCSRLLVNSLLSFALQGYSAIEFDSYAASQLFYHEAVKIWANESSKPTLTAASAAQYISLAAESYGDGEAANFYYMAGIDLGVKMGLISSNTEESSAKSWLDHHVDWIRAASHTAWGIFCRSTLHCMHAKYGHISASPLLPIPDEAVATALGKGSNQTAFESYSVPVYMRWTFNSLCKLWRIAQKLLWEYYDGENRSVAENRATIAFAEKLFTELLEWAASLPLHLARGDHNQHGTAVLHIYFHAIVLDLFRPFVKESKQDVKLQTFSTEGANATAVYEASSKQLKHLVLSYWTTFPSASYSLFAYTGLLYLANVVLHEASVTDEDDDSDWTFYFRLCITCYTTLYPAFRIVESMVKGLLSMAIRDDLLSAAEAKDIFSNLQRQGRHHSEGATPSGDFVVDLDLSTSDPDAAMMKTLVESFGDLTMFGELTTEEVARKRKSKTVQSETILDN